MPSARYTRDAQTAQIPPPRGLQPSTKAPRCNANTRNAAGSSPAAVLLSPLHTRALRSQHNRACPPPRLRHIPCHTLRPLSSTKVAHTPLEHSLSRRSAPLPQVLLSQCDQLAPQPTPELLNWVQIWRAGWHLEQTHLLSATGVHRSPRVQELFPVAENCPWPIRLLWVNGNQSGAQLPPLYVTHPLVRAHLL